MVKPEAETFGHKQGSSKEGSFQAEVQKWMWPSRELSFTSWSVLLRSLDQVVIVFLTVP